MDTIKRVQDLMQERDMNLCVLTKKCGISYSTIQSTARRGGQLSVETIERICQGLGITLKDFFDSSYVGRYGRKAGTCGRLAGLHRRCK